MPASDFETDSEKRLSTILVYFSYYFFHSTSLRPTEQKETCINAYFKYIYIYIICIKTSVIMYINDFVYTLCNHFSFNTSTYLIGGYSVSVYFYFLNHVVPLELELALRHYSMIIIIFIYTLIIFIYV